MAKRLARFALMILIVLMNIGCDQASKHIARSRLIDKGTVPVVGDFIVLRYVENQGAFLGLGAALPDAARRALLIAFPLVVLAGMVVYILRDTRTDVMVVTGLSFIAGGGLGNLIDRLLYDGRVGDFLNFGIGTFRTGIMNLADLSILVGMIILFIHGLFVRAAD